MDWTSEFQHWLDHVESKSDPVNRRVAALATAQLQFLTDLEAEPDENSKTLRKVSQSVRYPLWRVGHPFEKDIAVRLIVWFPPEDKGAVIVALGANKGRMGDIFYDGVGLRADMALDKWLKDVEEN